MGDGFTTLYHTTLWLDCQLYIQYIVCVYLVGTVVVTVIIVVVIWPPLSRKPLQIHKGIFNVQ